MAKTEKKGGKGEEKKGTARKEHAGLGTPAPAPRLKQQYEQTIRPRLMAQLGLSNPHQIPTLAKALGRRSRSLHTRMPPRYTRISPRSWKIFNECHASGSSPRRTLLKWRDRRAFRRW